MVLSSRSVTSEVDCNDFIKDGMLSSAELCGTKLVLKFNTDAGSQPISVELSSFVDNYDGKIQVISSAIDRKAEISTVQTVSAAIPLSVSQLTNDLGYLTAVPNTYKTYSDIRSSLSTDGYATSKDLTAYYKKTETSSSSQISSAIGQVSSAIPLSVSQLTNDSGYITSVPSTYKTYSDTRSSLSTDGYSISSDLSAFYKKTETSSSSQISSALSGKANLSSIEHVVQYEQDSNGIYTAVTIGARSSNVSADKGPASFVQGSYCIAVGSYAHAEGRETVALEDHAHAEGNETSATNVNSHAEGYSTLAAGVGSHAEGSYTSAFGDTSHTEGGWTSTG